MSRTIVAMRSVTDCEEYIDNPEAGGAVAAAVLVAIRLGAARLDTEPVSPATEKLLASHPFEADGELRLEAMRVFDRLTDPRDNEWHYLWAEVDALDTALELLAPYRAALQTAA